MKKFPGWLLMLGVTIAVAQPIEVDIKPADLLGGTADDQLRELGARAVEQGFSITVTSPSYWKDMIEEQIRAGEGADGLPINHRETFIESVIVRLHDPAAAPAVPARKATAEPAAPTVQTPAPPPPESPDTRTARAQMSEQARESAPVAPATEPKAAVPQIKPELTRIDPGSVMGTAPGEPEQPAAKPAVKTPAPVEEPPVTVQTRSPLERDQIAPPEPAPGTAPVEPEPVQPKATAPAVAQVPETSDDVEIDTEDDAESFDSESITDEEARASLARRLNEGRAITKSLTLAQLRRGDQVFTTGNVAAVVRATRVGRNTYLLDGAFNPDDEDVRKLRAGKYEVTGRVDVPEAAEPTAQQETVQPEPAEDMNLDERSEMEARYNEGRPIESTISPQGLLTDDILYVGDELIVVVRRDKVSLRRYWLEGDLDLDAEELEQRGNRKYRVRRAIR